MTKRPSPVASGDVSCPGSCQFAAFCKSGATRCIRSQDCEVVFSGGRSSDVEAGSSGVCYNCELPGCLSCADDKLCKECMPNFELGFDGKCWWLNRTQWYWVLGGFGLLGVVIFVDFALNCCMPNLNPEALYHGLLHRQAAKVRNLGEEGQPMYPLTVNVHTKQICGPGLTLFFNWFVLLFLVALWLTLISAIFQYKGDTTDKKLKTLCDSVLPNDLSNPESTLSINPNVLSCNATGLIVWTGLAYGGSVVLSVLFFIFQQRLWERMKLDRDSAPVLRRYTVEASGFPPDATDPQELLTWWRDVVDEILLEEPNSKRQLLGGSAAPTFSASSQGVLDVSVAYNFSADADQVTRLMDDHLNKCDLRASGLDEAAVQASSIDDNNGFADDEEPWRNTPCVQLMSFGMLGTDIRFGSLLELRGYDQTPAAVSREQKEDLLGRQLKGSGHMIVVFDTQELAMRVLEYYDEWGSLPRAWHDGAEIEVKKNLSEPTEIQWQNFGISEEVHKRRILVASALVPLIVVAWGALYFPWAMFSMNSAAGASGSLVTFTDQLLSVMIATGNCIVAYGAAYLTQWYGFVHTSKMQECYLLVIVPGVALNVIVDVAVTWNVLFADKTNLKNFIGDPSFFWSYGMDHVFNNIYGLLIPAYILVPYLLEPICTVCMSFWLGVFRIKSDKSISKYHAERIMLAPEIDIINPSYADMICTTSVFCWTLWAPNSHHWSLFLALAFWVALLYCQNRIRILRWQTRTFFSSSHLHRVQTFLWSIPLGILAGTFGAHWADCHSQWQRTACGSGAFLLHILAHCLILWLSGDEMAVEEISKEPYAEAIARHPTSANYLNTNPIEVLMSRMGKPNRRPLVYYKVGKDYLQEPGADLYFGRPYAETCCEGAFFSSKQDEEEIDEYEE